MFKKQLFLLVVGVAFIGTTTAQTYPTTSWRDTADTSWYDENETTFDISTAEALAGISELVEENIDFSGKMINITADIDLDAHLWQPIGKSHVLKFKGSVNGNNHTISNLWITGLNRDFLGLFGYCEGSALSDIKMDKANINDTGDASAALVGNLFNFGSMENCHVTNSNIKVIGANIGGLVGGLTTESSIKKSSFKGDVTGVHQVGGLLGGPWDKSSVSECFSEGSVTAEYQVGGLVGLVTFAFGSDRDNTITDCYSRSSVIANDSYGAAGGLLGEMQADLIVKNSYSTGSVTAQQAAGGFVGKVGNIVAENNYFDTETSGLMEGVGELQGSPIDVVGKTSAEMKVSDFVDLLNAGNNDGPWSIDTSRNDGYPILDAVLSVGDNQMNAMNFLIYPTVVEQEFHITSDSNLSSYRIYNISGSLVDQGTLEAKEAVIYAGNLGAGIYIVQIEGEMKFVSKKIIKK